MAVNHPPVIIGLYAALAATLILGGMLIWRGRAVDLDENMRLVAKSLVPLFRLEHFASASRMLLPFHGLRRRFGGSAASGER
jgi:hypothetical protein